ncbi:MAG TPA: cation:proton antiporter [Gaiellaceae bacterium]|nr:cation:proton antiporter [Gaiellaceae bacterium]
MSWGLVTIALVVLAYASVSRRLAGTSITAAIVFTGAGLLLGRETFGVIEPSVSGETVKLLAESTLAVVLFADAARIDLRALRDEYRVPARLLGIGLPLTIVAGLLAALLVLGSLGWPEALVLAIILAPTDAALGQAVVTLPSLPSSIRQGLNVESGLNDGICVPLFAVALTVASTEAGIMGQTHAATLLAEAIGYGVLFGVLAGAAAAAVVVLAGPRGLVDRSWMQIVPAAGAVLAYASAQGVGGSGFIATFVGGLVFGGIRRRRGGEVGYLMEQLGGLLGAATFVVFGGSFLGPAIANATWAVAGYAVLSLTLVRMVPVAIAMIGTDARPPTVAFLGWFGPRGLASIVFAVLVVEAEGTLPHEQLLLTTVFFTIGLSVLAHGVTAAPLGRRYARWFAEHPDAEKLRVETGRARDVRWRFPAREAR